MSDKESEPRKVQLFRSGDLQNGNIFAEEY